MKVIIAGSRTFNDYSLLCDVCDHMLQNQSEIEIGEGEPIEINHFNYAGRLVNQVKVDNSGLHFTEIAYNPDGVLKSVISRKYDDHANETEDDRFYTKDSVRVKYNYKFEYDKTGNWTKNTTSKNGKPIQVTERQIEYYTDPETKKKK